MSARVGALRHRVTFEAPVDTPDAIGGFARAHAPVAPLWARIEPISARRDFIAERQEQATTHRVTIRWRADVQQGGRFDFRGRKLAIRAVSDPREQRRFLICDCEEISP